MSVSTRKGLPDKQAGGAAERALDDIQMEVFDGFDRIDSMQSQWDDFVESLGYDIFNSYDWCRLWWKYYGGDGKLRIFVFRRQGVMIGLLPTYVEKLRIGPVAVKVARIVGASFTLAEVSPPISQAYLNQVVELWLERLYSEFRPDVVCVGPLSGTYDKTEQLVGGCAAWGNHRYAAQKNKAEVQTVFRLGASLDEYLACLSGKERHEVNRHCRNILKVVPDNNARLVCDFVPASGLARDFDDFVEMHNTQWQKLGESGHFNDWPFAVEFHREMASEQIKRGRLRLLKLCVGNFCVGYEYAYKFSRNYVHFLNSRKSSPELERVSVGKVGFCELVKKAVAEDVNLVNSLRSKYEYKLRMGGELVSTHTVLVCRNGLLAGLRVRAFKLLARLVNLCYYKIWFIRIAPKLPWRRRLLWNLWIRTNVFAY